MTQDETYQICQEAGSFYCRDILKYQVMVAAMEEARTEGETEPFRDPTRLPRHCAVVGYVHLDQIAGGQCGVLP